MLTEAMMASCFPSSSSLKIFLQGTSVNFYLQARLRGYGIDQVDLVTDDPALLVLHLHGRPVAVDGDEDLLPVVCMEGHCHTDQGNNQGELYPECA
ncbi:MAG: hypothetical protein MZW92_65770 [Comamonadaceae bacterium]|nr:hypothetical protein [Comamonadaceae bacterium]